MKHLIKLMITITALTFVSMSAKGEIFYPISKLKSKKTDQKTKLPKPKPQPLPELNLTGVIKTKNTKLAIINGKYLKEGDRIEGCKVLKILSAPPTTVLECSGIKVKLSINLLTPGEP